MENVCEEEGRWGKRIDEREVEGRGEREGGLKRGGCGDNRRIDSTRDTPGCFRGLNGSSTTFDNFDNANYKTKVHATASSGSSSENYALPRGGELYARNRRLGYSELFTGIDMSLRVAEMLEDPDLLFSSSRLVAARERDSKMSKKASSFEKFPINVFISVIKI